MLFGILPLFQLLFGLLKSDFLAQIRNSNLILIRPVSFEASVQECGILALVLAELVHSVVSIFLRLKRDVLSVAIVYDVLQHNRLSGELPLLLH